MIFYRFIVAIFLITPIIFNILSPGDFVYSFVYLPLLLLGFSLFFIWLDKHIKNGLTYIQLKKPSTISKHFNIEKIINENVQKRVSTRVCKC